jgi:hypothetical protein
MNRESHIYLPNEDKPGIVVPVYDAGGGFICEQEECVLVADWRDPIKLATSLRAALKQFTAKHCDLRSRGKSTDWPVFKASRCRTVREFECTYTCIVVRAFNEAELFYDAYAKPHHEDEITLHTTLNPYGLDVEFGRKVLRVFDACEKWTEHFI